MLKLQRSTPSSFFSPFRLAQHSFKVPNIPLHLMESTVHQVCCPFYSFKTLCVLLPWMSVAPCSSKWFPLPTALPFDVNGVMDFVVALELFGMKTVFSLITFAFVGSILFFCPPTSASRRLIVPNFFKSRVIFSCPPSVFTKLRRYSYRLPFSPFFFSRVIFQFSFFFLPQPLPPGSFPPLILKPDPPEKRPFRRTASNLLNSLQFGRVNGVPPFFFAPHYR